MEKVPNFKGDQGTLTKGKTQYSKPPCINQLRSEAFDIENIM